MKYAVQGCNFEENISFEGLVLEERSGISGPAACCLDCRKFEGCSAYKYIRTGVKSNTCILLGLVDSLKNDSTATSGIATGQCNFEQGIDLPLFTKSVVTGVANHEMCCYHCAQTMKCTAFTFYKAGPLRSECHLKYAVNNKLPAANVVTVSAPGGVCAYETGFSYEGFEMSTSVVATKELCCSACKSNSKCVSASFVTSGPKAKTCTLKSGQQNRITNINAVSGNGAKSICRK